ncbi:uncharacterized protein [Procambarus clarkii]|uniref:uncharacterized protein n=1 Tax=Procambarus clarkii TaxID=6728 RepID=UPI003742BB14
MRAAAAVCILGACVVAGFPQSPRGRSPQAYRDPPQAYREPPKTYQEESRYPAPETETYQQPPKYQKKYQVEEEEEEEYDDNVNTIPGEPGKDYPVHAVIPASSFSCRGKLPGFYADEASSCQVWHYCKTDGLMESFLCPNGTIYNQANRVCEWWFNVRCDSDTIAKQERVNEDLYIVPSPKPDQEYPAAPAKYSPTRSQYTPERQYDSDSQYQQPSYDQYQDQPAF